MSSIETPKDPFYTDFYHVFGKYPTETEYEYWRALAAMFNLCNRSDFTEKNTGKVIFSGIVSLANQMGMGYLDVFQLINDIANEYQQACQNFRIPMRHIRLGDMIPEKYDVYKLFIAVLVLTVSEQRVGKSRFAP